MVSALRGLFIACRAISSCSLNRVTSFVPALRGDLGGQAPFGNFYQRLASASAPGRTGQLVFVQLCFDTPWSLHAHGLVLSPGVDRCASISKPR